jgi:hypothetical protein
MNRSLLRALLGSVASALILIACQTVPTQVPSQPSADFCADAGNHCIVVSVDDGGVVSVDAEYLRRHGSGKIRWRVENYAGQKFYFPPGGIAFRKSDGGANVFKCSPTSDVHFVCEDPHGPIGEYKYTVTVTDGSSSASEDPRILNY